MSYLSECFEYNDGQLIWKVRPTKHFTSEFTANLWNSKYANTVAGSKHQSGYIHISLDGKKHKAHRIIWELLTGSKPKETIDHINGDKADNRIENLRDVSQKINCQNMKPRSKNLISGVFLRNRNGSQAWYASISIDGVKKHLLSTKDFFEAVCARKSAEIKHYGEITA
jgi:hypothetical protein